MGQATKTNQKVKTRKEYPGRGEREREEASDMATEKVAERALFPLES